MGKRPTRGRNTPAAAKKAATLAMFDLERESISGVAALGSLSASPSPPPNIPATEVLRRKVFDTLRIKLRSLNSYASHLRATRSTLTVAAERIECVAVLGDVQGEQSLCQMRLEELTAKGDVRDPGAVEEQNLLNAIAAVDAATKAGAAFLALVAAFRAVVAAYKVKDTIK